MSNELKDLSPAQFAGRAAFACAATALAPGCVPITIMERTRAYASLTTARFSSMLKILPITLLPEPFLEAYGLSATWSCQRDVPSVPIVCSGSLRPIGRH